MPYTIEGSTQDCYPGTTVLVNKLDILDPVALAEVEGTLVAAKAAQWEDQPLTEAFDFAHYCAIHRYLFEDLYSWAGHVRRVDISKQGTQFCPAAQISSVADAIFARLREQNYLCEMDVDKFLLAFVDFYERTNELLKDEVNRADYLVDAEISSRLAGLTPRRRTAVLNILDRILEELPNLNGGAKPDGSK